MAANKELYDLVKSLTPGERRYLKKLMKALAGNSRKKYQNHFDKVVSMKKYDDLIWLRKMGLSASKKQIKETNNYLYDFILKGLVMYTSVADKSKNKVLVEAQKVHILQQKGLYETTMRRVEDLIDLAQEQQFFDLSLHLLNEKRSIAFGLGLPVKDPMFMQRIYEDFDDNLDKAKNVNGYLRTLNLVKDLFEKYETIRSKEAEEAFEKMLERPLLRSSDSATSARSKGLYFELVMGLMMTLMKEEVFEVSDEALEYFHPSNRNINPFYYGFTLNKRMEICHIFRRWHEVPRYLAEMESHQDNLATYQQRKYWFITLLRHRGRYLFAMADEQGFEEMFAGIDEEFYESCRFDYADAYYENEHGLAKLYHLFGRYDEALERINNILGGKQYVRKELLLATRVLYLLIHHDLNNALYLPYAVQSLYRILLQSPIKYLAESKLITFLKKLPRLRNDAELRTAKKDLLDQWEGMKLDKYQRDFFYYFPYCEWIRASIEERPFLEVYRESVKERDEMK